MKNKDQLTKSIISSLKRDAPAVTIGWVGKENLTSAIEACLKDIEAKEALLKHDDEKKIRVYIIGRYRNRRSQEEYSDIRAKFPKFDIEYFTAHKSKGIEADYAIVFNLISGKYGFPCLIEDDPILSLVLAEKDSFPNAEERRLFYVAITRARKHVYLLSEESRPSSFVDELINEKKVKIAKYYSLSNKKANYEYDFGDGWEHEVLLENILPAVANTQYPKCIAGKRACPPEDCGGVGGYEDLLEIIANPTHEGAHGMVGGDGLCPQ